MSDYSYVAIDPRGLERRGTLAVSDQSEALRRIREMGLFPTKVLEAGPQRSRLGREPARLGAGSSAAIRSLTISIPWLSGRVGSATLTVFTRQLATLIEAGMPLLRGLRLLQEQEENRAMRQVIGELSLAIENGGSFAEAVAQHPKVFDGLYLNMVKAGEIGGALELTLRRLAEFMEKARKIKGKVIAAMFYPCSVMAVATAILMLLMVYIVPKFKEIFDGLLQGRPMPAFTLLVLHLSEIVKNHFLLAAGVAGAAGIAFLLALRTKWGRWSFDQFKLAVPVVGPVFRKVAISRFSRTLGTLIGSGVPILQALNIVKETAGNVVVGAVISTVHERVKEGEPIAPSLKASRVFPAMVAGMVDVGEQTGALPEMLMKVADNYDDEVDNAVNSMTSLLEPIMIVLLGIIVGSIVIALFLPIVSFDPQPDGGTGGNSRAD